MTDKLVPYGCGLSIKTQFWTKLDVPILYNVSEVMDLNFRIDFFVLFQNVINDTTDSVRCKKFSVEIEG